ncbi:MAG: acireductone synthase [Nitrospira sp.]
MPIRCVLLDIEGTIIRVEFVKDVLFPYAKKHLASFLHVHRNDSAVSRWAAVCQETIAQESGAQPSYEDLSGILDQWIDGDRKHQGLKALQGMIWEEGYRVGAFAPDLYEDVTPSLRSWRQNNLELALYSSGSEQAQRLLLGYTTDGDLTPLFSYYFDTGMGSKKEPASYARIADCLRVPSEEILFLSDTESELDAAAAAGLPVIQVVRPGASPGSRHRFCTTFHGLQHAGSSLASMLSPLP